MLNIESLEDQYSLNDTSTTSDPTSKEKIFKMSPDSILCRKNNGQYLKIDVKQNYKFKFEYVVKENDLFHKKTIFLKPDQILIKDGSLFSLKNLYYKETEDIHDIKLKDIRKIRIFKYKNYQNRFSVKTSPLSITNFLDGFSFKLAVEKRIFRNFSLCIEGGRYFSYGKKGLWSGSDGYLLNPEMRFYLNSKQETQGKYVSFDYRFKDRSFNWEDSILIPSPVKNTLYVKQYRIRTLASCFNIKYGFVSLINSLVIDCFIGVGIKFRNSTSTLTELEESNIYGSNNYSTFQMYRSRRGNFISPNITAGIKIGLCVK